MLHYRTTMKGFHRETFLMHPSKGVAALHIPSDSTTLQGYGGGYCDHSGALFCRCYSNGNREAKSRLRHKPTLKKPIPNSDHPISVSMLSICGLRATLPVAIISFGDISCCCRFRCLSSTVCRTRLALETRPKAPIYPSTVNAPCAPTDRQYIVS